MCYYWSYLTVLIKQKRLHLPIKKTDRHVINVNIGQSGAIPHTPKQTRTTVH